MPACALDSQWVFAPVGAEDDCDAEADYDDEVVDYRVPYSIDSIDGAEIDSGGARKVNE